MNGKYLCVVLGMVIAMISCAQPDVSRYETTERASPTSPARNRLTADQIIGTMKLRLSLTEEQEAQIRPIIEEDMALRQECMQKSQGQGRPDAQGMESMIKKIAQIQTDTAYRVSRVLTDEQWEKYQIMLEEQRKQRENMRSQMGGRKRPMGF